MSDALIGAGAQAVGGASSLAGGITQGMAARRQGLYQNQVAQINARLAQLQAKDAVRRGDIQASQALQRGGDIVSGQRTATGAGNVDPNSGSAAQSQASTAAVSQLDALTISHNAALEAIGYNFQAQNMIIGGKMAKIAGNNANIMDVAAGSMKFGQSLLQAGSNYNQYRPTVPVSSPQSYTGITSAWDMSNFREADPDAIIRAMGRNPEDAPDINNDGGQSPWSEGGLDRSSERNAG